MADHKNGMLAGSFLQIHRRIHVANIPKSQATRMANHLFGSNCMLIQTDTQIIGKTPSPDGVEPSKGASLETMYRFDTQCNLLLRRNPRQHIVFVTGVSRKEQQRTILLLGSHIMMTHDATVAEILQIFQPISDLTILEEIPTSLENLWNALHRAKEMQWISFQESFDSRVDVKEEILMDEYLHYVRC
jgi:hypothetical protein